MVTAAQVLPAAIWAAELSESGTTLPSSWPDGQEWLSAQPAPTTYSSLRLSATESGPVQSAASEMFLPAPMKLPRRESWVTEFDPKLATAPKSSWNWRIPAFPE